jgi:hypothetical protein
MPLSARHDFGLSELLNHAWRARRYYSVGMDGMKPQLYDRYSAELFCQHCGHYLTTRVGIDHDQLPTRSRPAASGQPSST